MGRNPPLDHAMYDRQAHEPPGTRHCEWSWPCRNTLPPATANQELRAVAITKPYAAEAALRGLIEKGKT